MKNPLCDADELFGEKVNPEDYKKYKKQGLSLKEIINEIGLVKEDEIMVYFNDKAIDGKQVLIQSYHGYVRDGNHEYLITNKQWLTRMDYIDNFYKI
jgi:hypothetical protein